MKMQLYGKNLLARRQKAVLAQSCLFVLLCLIYLATGACSSRYSLDLYEIVGDELNRIKIKDAIYVEGRNLADPALANFIIPGDNHLAALAFYLSGKIKPATSSRELVSFRERFTYRMYIPLPADLAIGPISLEGFNAFVKDLHSFDSPDSVRIFKYSAGNVILDSLNSSKIYLSINATFTNALNMDLKYTGSVKLKKSDRVEFRSSRRKSFY